MRFESDIYSSPTVRRLGAGEFLPDPHLNPPAPVEDVPLQQPGRRLATWALLVPGVAAVLIFGAGAVWVVSQPSQYTSRSTVIFEPKPTQSGVVSSDAVLQAAHNALSLIGASQTVEKVAEAARIEGEQLQSGTMAVVPPGTAGLEISVTTTDSPASAEAANAYADAVLREQSDSPTVGATVVGRAVASAMPSGPPTNLMIGVVALIAVIAGLLLVGLFLWWNHIGRRGGLVESVREWLTTEPAH